MTKLKKRLIVGASIVGAILVLAQAAWADGNKGDKAEQAQVTAAEHTAHHPGTAMQHEMMKQMGSGDMHEMMKQMGSGDMHEMMKQMGSGNMDEMMKQMGNGSMNEMMKMMQTPEGKQLMEKCLDMLKQQSEDAEQQ